jgi:alkanesulfonate monooxygenase SsuD/methylene tetrahydromethanopterin reductase-like flavin-dependent oxidoreductase (luciferase family)|tara:strand:+ start:398 stop:778 length:381 start_codon:yes stop_codon:yes gene_type:complete
MTRDMLNNITSQITDVEGLVYELREAMENLTNDAREAADALEEATPEQPDDDDEEPQKDDYADADAYTAAMEKHEAAVAAADEIREQIDRMETLGGLLRDLENANYPMDLEVDEYELGDAFAALNE